MSSVSPFEEDPMPLTDLALDELHDYRPEVAEPDDFDRFWADTLAEARDAVAPLPVVVEYVGYGGGRGLPEDRLRWAGLHDPRDPRARDVLLPAALHRRSTPR